MVLKTARGALEILEKNDDFAELISDVTSPGGTTEAALEVLINTKPNLKVILNKAILAANKRSIILGKNAKNEKLFGLFLEAELGNWEKIKIENIAKKLNTKENALKACSK